MALAGPWWALLSCCLLLCGPRGFLASPPHIPSFRFAGLPKSGVQPSLQLDGLHGHPPVKDNCTEHFFQQRLDHFGRDVVAHTFSQRYFLCSNVDDWSPGDPVFLYLGNEADVELYLNATGLMWENAPAFKARLVFVEHRYFGKSSPPERSGTRQWDYLTTDQAIADYAAFVSMLRRDVLKTTLSPIVGFGGSYGGMLCAWLRISSPWSIDACLAASAPIMSFMGMDPPVDPNFFAKGVTRDMDIGGGCAAACHQRVHGAWRSILSKGSTSDGLVSLTESFGLCSVPKTPWDLVFWLSSAFDFMAMGSYPYESSYILNGRGFMPPYPLRKACGKISAAALDQESQFAALREAVSIFYNASGAGGMCFNTSASGNEETTEDTLKWNYLYCSEMFQVFGRDGVTDMYWDAPWNVTASLQSCREQYGLLPDVNWVAQRYGGWHISKTASRILFSNGGLDPWAGGGVTKDLAPELPAVVIPGVGHHIDLFWSRDEDTAEVRQARQLEMSYIRRWIAQARDEIAARSSSSSSNISGRTISKGAVADVLFL